MTIQEARTAVRNALATLSNAIDDEMGNLDRFEDDRMLVATADLERHYKEAIERADELADLYNDWKCNGEDGPEKCTRCDGTGLTRDYETCSYCKEGVR